MFAAGNGGIAGDSCAFSGYVNSIHTIAISAVNWDGSVPAYIEQCAAIMAVTYGQDMFTKGQDKAPIVSYSQILSLQTIQWPNYTKNTIYTLVTYIVA